MAIEIKFDLIGNPEAPTIILANRNGNMLGQLKINEESIDLLDKFNGVSEFSFTINKYVDNKLTPLWEKIIDFKLVYCKEWDTWFEIKVELDEATETVKTIFCTQLGQAELSQIKLYNVEINTDKDIERDDYKISILFDGDDPEASILNRMLKDKAPHYSITYVHPTIAKIQRSFSFDDISICDAFYEISEEIGCLFQFHVGLDENGRLLRKIAVYDLQQNCRDCGHRGEFTGKCPECGSTNIEYGFGDDTTIFVTSDELASEGIRLVTDVDSVKNCFKLEAGDDLMTATIRNCNPNGSDYLWYFSNTLKEDMTDELVQKLDSYNEMYKEYYNEYVSNLDTNLLKKYNSIVDKYAVYNEDLQQIVSPIKGYPALMKAYYNVVDLSLYLESGLMPSVKMSDTNSGEQAKLLTASSISPVAVADITVASLPTMESAVLAMAKTIVMSTYKIDIDSSETFDEGNSRYWKGNFIVTNYSDEEDSAVSNTITVEVNDDLESFVKQKIEKALNKENTDDLSVTGLFKKSYDDFCKELKKYALNPLLTFHDACQACIDILIEQGVGNNNATTSEDNSENDLYENLYVPYYEKLIAIESEIKIREDEIAVVSGTHDSRRNSTSGGLLTEIEKHKNKIQDALNFEKYLDELWLEFCAYRREDKYSNENYISDGLNNTELFERALEFIDVASDEIYKSSELQHSISATLNNLLAIPKFKPLVKSFKTGNWIRVQIDDDIYKLRLLEYEINYKDFDNIPVKFSDVIKIRDGISDISSILNQASSIATSYSSVKKQAEQGTEAQGTINQWLTDGLNSALVQIQSNNTEDITITKNGLLCRSYDDITDTYSPEQLKLTHNIMAYTDDDWRTVRHAIGKHRYVVYDEDESKFVNRTGYGISADFVTAGIVNGSQIIGGDIYSDNYSKTDKTGSYINLRDGTFDFGGGRITFNGEVLTIDSPDSVTADQVTEIAGDYIKTAAIYAENLQVNAANIDGKLVADQIDAAELEVDAANIIGTLQIGNLPDGVVIDGDIPTKLSDLINDMGFQDETGVTSIVGGVVTTDYVNALGITVKAANIDGKLVANQIDAANLKVNAANIEGELTAATISVGKVSGAITEDRVIEIADGRIKATEISADQISGGTLSGVKIVSPGVWGDIVINDSQISFGKSGYIYGDDLGFIRMAIPEESGSFKIYFGEDKYMEFSSGGINYYKYNGSEFVLASYAQFVQK